MVQAWRQKHLENQATLTCQVADIAEGLAFEHVKYNVIIDVVSGKPYRLFFWVVG